ncbi:hypothetical protein JHK82_051920 [Glycine max]|uniref:Uncharacterized protein n=1 Tax=Glycine max TaxID=3847 RepID=A0A0R0F5R6_SOYBN|nr:hypothetical protein JHK87_051653 [Glycine soja]KAG5093142.1 hypothetical protein JHK82_051920 [Glycine max]KAG5096209.1 hypothetical protein JHK84_051797 [Glycine max]
MALSFSHHPVLHGNKLPLALQSQCITSSKPNNTCTFTYPSIRCCSSLNQKSSSINLKTCKNCKTQFDPALNHPLACRFHTARFGVTPTSFLSSYLFCPCTLLWFSF